MVQSQEPEATVEFATSGDFLLLDATERVVIGVDMDTLLNSNNLNDAISSVSSLDGAHNGVLTGIAHDEINLYLTYSDGVIEEYENHGGEDDFAHWVLSEVDALNPPATSVDIHYNKLYWTSEGDSTVYSMYRSLFGLTWTPIERVIDDPTYAGGLSGIVVSEDLRGADRAPVISVLDADGSTVIVTDQELAAEVSIAGERLWVRGADGVNTDNSVRAIEEIKVNQSGFEQTVLIALDGDSLRILERKEASSQLHIFSASVDSEEANFSSQNFASTGVADNELREYTVLQFSSTQLNSNNRCFPLRITFDELTPFTYEQGNSTMTGGSVTLSIGGVEKTVTHEEISSQTLLWGPENNDELIPDMCVQTSSTVDFTIVDWEPTNLVANVVLSDPETVPVFADENSSWPTSWSRSDITWSKGPSSVATPRASDSVEVFGDHVFEEMTGISLVETDSLEIDDTTGRMYYPTLGAIVGISLINLGPVIHPVVRVENVALESVVPIQSVWDPVLYTQEKDMWWAIDLSYEMDDSLGWHNPRNTVTVELLTQGTECTINGVECPIQYRLKDTWEHYPFLDKWLKSKFVDERTFETILGEYMEPVSVLRFEIPLSSIGPAGESGCANDVCRANANVVIPFTDAPTHGLKNANHQNVHVQPAEPDSPRYIGEVVKWNWTTGTNPAATTILLERGVVKWKVVVDPENELGEDSDDQLDNSKGWNSPWGEVNNYDINELLTHVTYTGKEYSTTFGDVESGSEDDTFRILVVRTRVIFNECDDWHWFWWNDCLDRDHQIMEPPNAEWAEEMIVYARAKMQEMFPFPEDRLQMDLWRNELTHEVTEHESISDWANQVILRTSQTFGVIDLGIELGDLLHYDRIVLLTHSEVAEDAAGFDWDDRIFGIFKFEGFCPCSKAVILPQHDSGYIRHTAETLIHEIGHSMLVGHDNQGGFDVIFNNCGHPDAYDWDIPGGQGWSPINFGSVPPNYGVGIELDGQSFMRYKSDGETYSWMSGISNMADYDADDYGFKNSWIQDIDYRFIQRSYDFDAGEDYLTEYWIGVLQNLVDQIIKSIYDQIVAVAYVVAWIVGWIIDAIVWAWDGIEEGFSSFAMQDSFGGFLSNKDIRFDGFLSPSGDFMAGNVQPGKAISTSFGMLDTNFTFVQLDRDGAIIMETPVTAFENSSANLNGVTALVAVDDFDERTVAWMLTERDGNVVTTGTIPLLSPFNVSGTQSHHPRGDTINLSWGEVVTEGLTYDLTLISEGGSTEILLAKGWTRPWIELDTSGWDRGTYQLVVKASDGFRDITEMSDEFSVTGIDHEISWVSSSLAAPGEEVMMVIDYFDDINSFARSAEMNCTYTADDWNVQVEDSLDNRVLLSMTVRNDPLIRDVRPQIVVDCDGHPPNYISHPVSMVVNNPDIDIDDVGDVFDDLDLDIDPNLDLDKPYVEKAFFADIDGDGVADFYDRCYPVMNMTQCEEMLIESDSEDGPFTDDQGTNATGSGGAEGDVDITGGGDIVDLIVIGGAAILVGIGISSIFNQSGGGRLDDGGGKKPNKKKDDYVEDDES